jgi:hypothetical protein
VLSGGSKNKNSSKSKSSNFSHYHKVRNFITFVRCRYWTVYHLLVCDSMLSGRSLSFGVKYCLHLQDQLVTGCAYSSTFRMETVSCSEKSVNFYRTIRRLITEDSSLPETLVCEMRTEGTRACSQGSPQPRAKEA